VSAIICGVPSIGWKCPRCPGAASAEKQAAKKFFRKLLKGCTYVPRVLITDKLASYGAAKREVLPSVEHRQIRWRLLMNRVMLQCPSYFLAHA
jgi:hypothetical protein